MSTPTGSRPGRHSARHSTRRSDEPGVPVAAPRSATRRGLLLGAQIVAGVLSAVIVLGTGWVWYEYRSFRSNVAVGSAVPLQGGSGTTDPSAPRQDQNILLLGNDSRAGATPAELQALGTQDDGGSSNTDTMLVLHVPADGTQATAISFPRDSYVSVPGYGKGKLNSAYPDGYQTAKSQGADETAAQSAGIQVLIATLNKLTGVTINHYVQVNLLGFYRISLAIGGVSVCLKQAAKEPNSGIDLPAGVTPNLSGTQALAFVRQRYGFPDGQGDLDRIHRQQYFLSAVFRKVLSADTLTNPSRISKLLGAVSSSLLIDPDLDLLGLASQLSDLQAGNLNFYTIPTTGFADVDGAGSVVTLDDVAVKAFVDATFYPAPVAPSTPVSSPGTATTTTPTTAPPVSTPTTGVVDGSGTASAVNGADADCIY